MSIDAILAAAPKIGKKESIIDAISYHELVKRLRMAGIRIKPRITSGTVVFVTNEGAKIAEHWPYFYIITASKREEEIVKRLSLHLPYIDEERDLFIDGIPVGIEEYKDMRRVIREGEVYPPYGPDGEMIEARLVAYFDNGEWRKCRIGSGCNLYVAIADDPSLIPKARETLNAIGIRWSMANIRYPARVTWDYGLRVLGVEPLYVSEPPEEPPWPQEKILVFDIEIWGGNLLFGYLEWDGNDPSRDDVGHLTACIGDNCNVPDQSDEIRKLLSRYRILYGFNIQGFDLPQLAQHGLLPPEAMQASWLDSSIIAANYGQSLGIGEAKSLKAIAAKLREAAGITDEELSMKELGKRALKNANLDELTRYNANDVILTAKIGKPMLRFLFAMAGLLQVPPSVVQTLSSGLLAEYFLARSLEIKGAIIEYRQASPRLTGSKTIFMVSDIFNGLRPVFSPDNKGESSYFGYRFKNVVAVDVKAMYPNFVLHNKLDPYMLREEKLADKLYAKEYAGVNPPIWQVLDEELEKARRMFEEAEKRGKKPAVWRVLRKIYETRMKTRKMKKQNPMYEPVDSAVKAVLNALAYGTLAKRGYAPFANSYVTELIFHGTRAVLFTLFARFREVPEVVKYGCRPVYGDTDSAFLVCTKLPDDPEARAKAAEEIAGGLTRLISKYGLELEAKGVYDIMVYYERKNYVLVRDGKPVEIKGGMLHNVLKAIPEPLKPIFEEALAKGVLRVSEVRKVVEESPPDELVPTNAEMVARMLFRVEKERQQRERIIVRTPWSILPAAPLLSLHAVSFGDANRLPLAWIAANNNGVVDLAELNPIGILSVEGFPGAGRGSCVAKRLRCNGVVYDDERGLFFCLRWDDVFYVFENGLRIPVGKLRELPKLVKRYNSNPSVDDYVPNDIALEEATSADEALSKLFDEIMEGEGEEEDEMSEEELFQKALEEMAEMGEELAKRFTSIEKLVNEQPRLRLLVFLGLRRSVLEKKAVKQAIVDCILDYARELKIRVV